MANAHCLCGALSLKLRETSKLIVACHCLACQRRTGSPFGLGVFHAIDTVERSWERLRSSFASATAAVRCDAIFVQHAARRSIGSPTSCHL